MDIDWNALALATIAASHPTLGSEADMYAFAMDQAEVANGYITQLGIAAGGLAPPVITPVFPVGPTPPAISVPKAPSVAPIVWEAPALPPIFSASLNIENLFPSFTAQPPVLIFPTPPTYSAVAPSNPVVNLPTKYPTLSVTLPTAPSLLSLSTYTYHGNDLPVIDGTIPTLTLVAPSLVPYTAPKLPYTDALLSTVQATLMDRIKSGTNTGLPPAVEQALWDRAREKEMIASQDAIDELERMEALGYAFPPGVYMNARLKVQTDMGYKSMGLSREVSITQAQLIQKTITEAIGQAVDVEKMLVDYTNKIEQLTFESCKYATEAGIEIYNAQVKKYEALLDGYKAKIAYFDAQVREQEAAVKIYETEIQAEKLKSDMNTALVQQYEVMSKVAEINVDIYKAELDGVRIQAEIQKIIVEIYGEQVKAYGANVNAFTSQVEAYRAQIQSAQTQEQVYKTQVDAYASQVEAVKAQITSKVEVLKANVAGNMAAWDGYKGTVVGLSEQAKSIAMSNSATADVYKSVVSGTSTYNETLTKQWNVTLEQAERVAEVGVSAAKANAELYMTTRSLALDASKVGATVNAQMGSAAIGAINWSTHYSYGTTNSTSQQTSNSVSQSTATNTTSSTQLSSVFEQIHQEIASV
jgi:transcription elongation factor Elf1